MSRYFTSPPPVYARNWTNGQNLVELTKIEPQQIVASKKVQRKEKKKGTKKEKSIKHVYLPTKQVSVESEQLERSCLTEEHEQHSHVGYLSDGSQNSKKRRREASSPTVESNIKATPVVGNPLRIRFVFKKPKEAEVVVPQVPQEEPVCLGTDRPSEISTIVSGHADKLLSASLERDEKTILSESNKKKKHRISKETRYSSLFDEPVVPCTSMEEDNSTSDDWLLGARQQENSPTMSCMNEDMVMNMQESGDSCFPRSQFLSEVGIFSLPYTALF